MCRKMTPNGNISLMTSLYATSKLFGYAVRMHGNTMIAASATLTVVEQSTDPAQGRGQ